MTVTPPMPSGATSQPLALSWCRHVIGGLPCVNPRPHAGRGRGCVHHGESGVPDRHDYGDDE